MHHLFHKLHELRANRHGGRHHGFFGMGSGDFGAAPDFGGGLGGRFRFGPGRKLGSTDLQLLLLSLLAEKPSHGYELIKALEEKSKGYYTPSPGMVYPALTYLEEIGHASVQVEGTKKRYHITDDGLAHLDTQRAVVDALLQQLAWIGGRVEQMRKAMSEGEEGDDADFLGGTEAGDDAQGHGRGHRHDGGRGRHGDPELHRMRHALKGVFMELRPASREQQQKVVAILERTVAEIRAVLGGASL